MEITQKLRETAYHEAGHALISLLFGMNIRTVTIDENDDYFGCVTESGIYGYVFVSKQERKNLARESIIGFYAGYIAECLVNPNADVTNSEWDEYEALKLSSEYGLAPRGCTFGDDNQMAYLEKFRKQAKMLILQNRRTLDIIVKILLEKKTVTGEELKILLQNEGISFNN